MPTSTWKAVRDKLLDTLVAQYAALGFANSGAVNAHKALPDEVPKSGKADYWWGQPASGDPVLRAYAVIVQDEHEVRTLAQAQTNIVSTASIHCWYAMETNGEGRERLQEHVSVIRQAFRLLGVRLGDTVLKVDSWGVLSINAEARDYGQRVVEALHGQWQIVASNPNGQI